MRYHLLAAALLAAPSAALADTNVPEERLVHEYRRFAGSTENAQALVQGLRNDTKVQLTAKSESASFKPATGKMGYGNVDTALSLAQGTLATYGIHKPSPEQIEAALNGGTITAKTGETIALQGVLQQRASGMGWGQIAQANGFKLGELKRSNPERVHGKPHGHGAADDRPVKFDKPERPVKFDRPERPERPHRR
jgi:hypothetical protein